jgi:polyphosphate kinase
MSAARNGKKVTVLVELKARLDEANNLRRTKKMKTAGIKIINRIPGLKVHAKIALLKREEDKKKIYYSFLATGNFNEATGRFYTDHVYFTANNDFSKELEQLFFYLQSRMQPEVFGSLKFKHLLVSQFNMIKQFRKKIYREIKHAKEGKPANIIIKLNNLQESEMIDCLYAASNAGVKVQLLVRSICCLNPGVPGQSENITVHRIVDRYLEHARVFMFLNDGNPKYYMGSADWMNRNLHSRVEVVFPVIDRGLCEELNQILRIQLSDNTKAVYFKSDYSNERINSNDNEPVISAQEEIYRFIKRLKE